MPDPQSVVNAVFRERARMAFKLLAKVNVYGVELVGYRSTPTTRL